MAKIGARSKEDFIFIYLFIFRNEMLPTKKDDKIDFLVSAYN